MADIFREIDEELQQEKAAKLWKRFGPYVIALAVLVIAAVAGYRFWQSFEADQRVAQSARYEAAAKMLGEDPGAAAAEFGALAGEGNAGYTALATLRQAAALIEADDSEGAVLIYKKMAGDQGMPAIFRDLARLLHISHRIDSGDPAELSGEVSALASNAGPWHSLARETEAMIALKVGDTAKALEILQTLNADPATPRQQRARVTELVSAIGAV